MITKSKRILSSVLAMILLITGLLPMSVSAADVTMDLSKAEVSWDYTLTDEEGNAFAAAYGLKAEDNPFGGAISPMLRRMHDYTAKRPGLTSDKSQWVYGEDYVYCFCIEHGVPLPDSGSYSGSSNLTHGNKYEMLSENQKTLLSLALAYGYPNRTDLETSKDANACYSATQLIVWQIMSCVWLDYMVKYFQCKNCVGSSPKTKKCVASFLVPVYKVFKPEPFTYR